MKLSLASSGAEPASRFLEQVKLADLLGFHAFFHSDIKWAREPFSRLGAATQVTTRLGLAAGVLDPYTRHAAILAQAAATLAELAPGRLRVIMGAGSRFATLPGCDSRKPVTGLREAAALMRSLWGGEKVTLDGEVVKLRDGALDWTPGAAPPLYLAGRGPRMLELAGTLADGVLIGSFATKAGIDHAKTHIRSGLDASQREWSNINLCSWIGLCMLERAEDPVPATIAHEVGATVWSSRHVLAPIIERLAADTTPAFRKLLREAPVQGSQAPIDALRRLMPRGVIDSLALIGTATQVVDRLKALEAAGVQEVVIRPFPAEGQNEIDFMYKLAHEVLPHLSDRLTRKLTERS
jgi:5,10-methylenetetrahydromethanopterin reductase